MGDSRRKPQGGPPVAGMVSQSKDSSSKAMLMSTIKLWVFGFICYGIYGKYNGNTDDAQFTVIMPNGTAFESDNGAITLPSDSPLINKTVGSMFKTRNGGADIDWDLVTCLYFAMETVTTVGYGDIVPGNDTAKVVTIFVCLIGVMVISQSIGTIANWFVEQNKQRAKAAQKRMLENAIAVAAEGDDEEGGEEGEDNKKQDAEDEKQEAEDTKQEAEDTKKEAVISGPTNSAIQELSIDDDMSTAAAVRHDSVSPRRVSASGKIIKTSKRKSSCVGPKSDHNDTGSTAIPVKKTGMLNAMESFKERFGHRAKVTLVALKCCIPLYVYITACFVLGEIEGWSGIDSFYFSIITMTTVGFGDVTPVTRDGRLFACFLLPVGLIALTIVGGTMMDEISKVGQKGEKTIMELLDDLKEVIEQDDDGTVTEEEYLLFCLMQQKRVDEEELDILRQQFQALDADGSGELDEDDVVALTAQCKKLGMDH